MRRFWIGVCVMCWILIKYNMSLCQGEGLLMLCLFWKDLMKNSEPKISSFLHLLTWKRLLIRLLIGCQGKVFILLCCRKVSQDIWLMELCFFIKVVKLLAQSMGNYKVHFMWMLVSINSLLWVHFYLWW